MMAYHFEVQNYFFFLKVPYFNSKTLVYDQKILLLRREISYHFSRFSDLYRNRFVQFLSSELSNSFFTTEQKSAFFQRSQMPSGDN